MVENEMVEMGTNEKLILAIEDDDDRR